MPKLQLVLFIIILNINKKVQLCTVADVFSQLTALQMPPAVADKDISV